MKILVLGINYWPEETGIAPYNTWRCEYLASRGHAVAMCTTFPYYPHWRVEEPYKGRLHQTETRNGVRILRSWTWIPRNVTSIKRVLHEASFLATNLATALAQSPPDLILVESPPLGLGVTALILSRLWRVPYVFDVMDLQPDAAVELGMLRPGRLVNAMYGVERLAYKGAAIVSTLTEGMRQRIIEKGIPASRVVLFPPRADSQLFAIDRNMRGQEFRRAHGLAGKFVVAHSGNMGVKQGLDVIIDAAKICQDRDDIAFLMVGDGAERTRLETKCRELDVQNVRFLPVQSPQMFHQMLAATDLGLITQLQSVSDIVFPSKTTTLLASGCPVLASVNDKSEVARALRQSGAGVVVRPEDARLLSTTILDLSRDHEKRELMSASGRQYALDRWDEHRILVDMERTLLNLHDRSVGSATYDSVQAER